MKGKNITEKKNIKMIDIIKEIIKIEKKIMITIVIAPEKIIYIEISIEMTLITIMIIKEIIIMKMIDIMIMVIIIMIDIIIVIIIEEMKEKINIGMGKNIIN